MDALDALPKTKPDAPVRSTPVGYGRKRAVLAAILLSGAVYALLPSPVFRTESIVGVGDSATPMRAVMVEAAAKAAVSNSVISQAAASLVDANLPTPGPALLGKLTVAARLDTATSRETRLSRLLRSAVTAGPGDAPGIVRIVATLADAAGAARIATSVAETLVSYQQSATAEMRTRQDMEAARHLDDLRASARTAHQNFVALGGSDIDPARTRASAAALTAAAQGRVDVVRAILASGTPPISDRHDLPEHVAALQSAYLDLSQKLATARETYGERHTIVISLAEGTKRAGAALTTEWRRLSKAADAELAAARDREAALRKPASPGDAAKRDAIETARLAATAADDAVARAERARRDTAVDETAIRLLAPAPVPLEPSGLALPLRIALSALAGLVALIGVRYWTRRHRRTGETTAPMAAAPPAEPSFFEYQEASPETGEEETSVDDASNFVVPQRADLEADMPRLRRAAPLPARTAPVAAVRTMPPVADDAKPARRPAPVVAPAPARAAVASRGVGADVVASMTDLLDALDHVVPIGDLTTVLVATLDEGAGTTPIAEALATAAAEDGLRVLLVELEGATAALAALAEIDADPILVDLFGALRIALPVEAHDGMMHVVPVLRGGATLAARLARAGDVPLVEDLAEDFDLVIIDGRAAAECVSLAGLADAVVRVGRHPSKREDERLLSILGMPAAALVGTIAASTFAPRAAAAPSRAVPLDRPNSSVPGRSVHRAPPRPESLPRRRVASR